MGKALLTLVVIGLVAAFMYRDQISGGWLGVDLGGPTSVMTGTSSYGAGLSSFGQKMGDAFR